MSILIVVSGPSGVGKGTLLRRVLDRFPELQVGLSWTTREWRVGDDDGIKRYQYVSRDEFMQAVERGEFLEWAEFGGNLYGSWYREEGHTLLEIEVQGAQQVLAAKPDAYLVGILPPGNNLEEQLAVVEQRLLGRGSEDKAAALKRLAAAPSEIAALTTIWPRVIVNNDLEQATHELIALIEPLMSA